MSGWTVWPQNVQQSKSGLAWSGPITFSPLRIWTKTHLEKLTSGVKGGHDFWVRIRATQTVCARTISGLWLNSATWWMNEQMEAKWWGNRTVTRAGRPIQTVTVRTDLWGYASTPSKTRPLVAWLPSSPQFSSVQLFSRVRLFATPWTAARQASLSITNSWGPPKPMSIESVMPSNNLILCRPLFLLPSNFASNRVFSNESALHIRWPKYSSFSFNISPSNEHPEVISFRMDWLDLLAVQGTLKSLLQHHSSKASILQRSAFSIVQLSHPYMTTGKP